MEASPLRHGIKNSLGCFFVETNNWSCRSLVRTPVCLTGSGGFDSHQDRHYNARLAELVDALVLGTSIERCGGSSPSSGTICYLSVEVCTADCESASLGSIPRDSTIIWEDGEVGESRPTVNRFCTVSWFESISSHQYTGMKQTSSIPSRSFERRWCDKATATGLQPHRVQFSACPPNKVFAAFV